MTKTFTLTDYKEAADKQYGCYEIKLDEKRTARLLNPMRLGEDRQNRVFEIMDEITKTDEDEEGENKQAQWQEVGADVKEENFDAEQLAKLRPLLLELVEVVGDAHADALVEVLREDFAVLMAVFQDYISEVGLGEAASSES